MIASPPDLIAKLALYSIDAIADMIVWADREGRYVCVNKAAQRLLGYTEEEFQGRRVCDVDPLFDEARWQEHWAELERLGSVTLETVNTTKDGVDVSRRGHGQSGFRGRAAVQLFHRARHHRAPAQRGERRALNERIYQLSITDGLTGISNRRRFDEALASLVAQHARSGKPLSVILIDIDHFKAFNDHYGHLSGDDCLRQVAAVIASLMRGERATLPPASVARSSPASCPGSTLPVRRAWRSGCGPVSRGWAFPMPRPTVVT